MKVLLFLIFFKIFFCIDSKFRQIYDESPEGRPYLYPSGNEASYLIGLSLCQNVEGMGVYLQVRGMLTDGDCATLYYMATFLSMSWRINNPVNKNNNGNSQNNNNNHNNNNQKRFKYVETGSYQGLSAHIVATALASSIGDIDSIIYSHDLFDETIPDKDVSIIENTGLWERFMDDSESRLEKFYSNVQRNGYEKMIIPISGPSTRTLKIHKDQSAHLVFIDGDHTYQGAFLDLYEGWRILAPGGWMLVHDCTPDPNVNEKKSTDSKLEVLEVRQAVRDFVKLYNVSWNLIAQTMYMAGIQKPYNYEQK